MSYDKFSVLTLHTPLSCLVQKIKILRGIADHEIMVADVNLKPKIGCQKPRNAPLYRKADWDGFRKYFSDFASDFIIDYENKTVEDLWNSFTINQGISKFIPIKKVWSKEKPSLDYSRN